MRLIPIECVKVDSINGRSIYDNNKRILLKSGTKLTSSIIQKMVELNIKSLYVNDEYSVDEINKVIKPDIREKSITLIQEAFSNVERITKEREGWPKTALKKKNIEYFSNIYSISMEVLDNVLSNNRILFALVDLKNMEEYLYIHAIKVYVYSLVIGISLKMHKDDLIELAIGAMLHDIGKVFISKDIINRTEKLTEEEELQYWQHAELGYEYIGEDFSLKSSSRLVTLQHHERVDGTGYPNGLEGNKIHKYSRIVAIADCFARLTSDNEERKALPINEALEYIMSNAGKIFDFELVDLFSKIIIPYPAGELVKLSNGDVAVVKGTPANFPLRPTVQIVKSENIANVGRVIYLVDELSIVITKVLP